MEGVVFEIKQMAVFDGPGIRTTVFLKGCPLRCAWCHNPEGLSVKPELMVSKGACTGCGKCREVCPHKDGCRACGKCIRVCPAHLRRISGTMMDSAELAKKLLKDRDYLDSLGGGVTFSGGEPTAQAEFLTDCLERLKGMHRAIETSGYCQPMLFHEILKEIDYVMMDLKLIDNAMHKKYTGVDNVIILNNLEQVKKSGKPFRIRIPVIPGVNDSEENFKATARLLTDARTLDTVELLPYHKTAGAKYEMIGMSYNPGFDVDAKPNMNLKPFWDLGIECRTI